MNRIIQFFQDTWTVAQPRIIQAMPYLGRFFTWFSRLIFISLPVWFYHNIVVEACRSFGRSVRQVARANAGKILLAIMILGLIYTGQDDLLQVLLAGVFVVIGFVVMFRGFGSKRRGRRR